MYNDSIKQENKTIVSTSNGNSTIEANDTVRFNIDLRNIGEAQAMGIIATLTGNSTLIKSCSSVPGLYPVIGHSETKKNMVPFEFVVSSTYVAGNALNFKLKVENKYGKIWNYDFNLDRPAKVTVLDFTADTTVIDVTWKYSSANAGYNIYRCNADIITGNPIGNYLKINTDYITFGCYKDVNLNKLSKYIYWYRRLDRTFFLHQLPLALAGGFEI